MKKKGVKQSQRGRMKKNKGVEQLEGGKMKKNKVASTSTLESVLPPYPPWLELPEDVTAKILQKLGPVEIMWTAQKVCKAWWKICRDPTMWRVIDMWKLRGFSFTEVHKIYGLPYELEFSDEVIMHLAMDFSIALDLSRGQVTEINIEEFGNDFLLEYIAARCGNIRCLRLAYCKKVFGKALSKVVKGFPLLEELHLQFTPVSKGAIEAIGQACPMLKTFALNAEVCKYGILKSSEEALAIATFMPELRHLQLFRNGMTNEGLEAILNGCPKLESLDLRFCFHLNLEGELEKRCAQQIKFLRRPHDPTDDFEWDPSATAFENMFHDFHGLVEEPFPLW